MATTTKKFSGALVLTDLNDFITPSQACIKPVVIEKDAKQQQQDTERAEGEPTIKIHSDGSYVQVTSSGEETKLKKAKISLNDCLACSGCITTAESILIEMQSQEELYKVLEENQLHRSRNQLDKVKTVVITISPHSCASFAGKYGLPMKTVYEKLNTFFKQVLGCDYVINAGYARNITTIETQREFVERYKQQQEEQHSSVKLPLLTSECPGWICYAEKSHGSYILPYISSAKSPQQVMGTLVKDFLGTKLLELESPNKVYHVAVMPCYDKKLEASRQDFYNDIYSTRDVDCVITSGEVEIMFEEKSQSIADIPLTPMAETFAATPSNNEELQPQHYSYLEAVFRYAAKELFNVDITEPLEYKIHPKNPDMREVTLKVDGKVVLHFAIAYGFRNIQNIVRKIKNGKCSYHFVEIMACPSACLNGGGQLKPFGMEHTVTIPPEAARALLAQVEQAYLDDPTYFPPEEYMKAIHTSPFVRRIYTDFVNNETETHATQKLFHTSYHFVEDTLTNPLTTQW